MVKMGERKPQHDMLDWMGIRRAPDWKVARPLGSALAVFIALLVFGAYFSSFAIVYGLLFGGGVANLGTGALIAALLGAPFVIWGTLLKHQTLRYQKEGHITDRITSAVEQLGAEKVSNRIGRPVTIWTGKPIRVSCPAEQRDKYLVEPRSKVISSEWTQSHREETGDVWEGILYDIATWPTEKTIIQWQGEEIELNDSEEIGNFGAWQVFTETEPNIEVRIGAILSLERIAQDSTLYDNARDHVRVMEILCAYVRQNAPASAARDFPFPKGCKEDSLEEKRKSIPRWLSNEFTPRADVQLALSVIGRRAPEQVKAEREHSTQDGTGYRIDLSRTNLRYANLERLNFENASFFRSQMQAAFCNGANFGGANFVYCELTGVNAANSNFSHSKIEAADFSFATLAGANLHDCKMSHTHFVRTNIKGARIRFLDNEGNREVNRAFFIDSDLKGALIEGDMLGIVFSLMVSPGEAIPRDIYGVAFKECRIGGVRQYLGKSHSETAIPADWLGVTFGDSSVILTEDMPRPVHWPHWELPSHGGNSFESERRRWQANPLKYVPPPAPSD
jgi:uncharacterized protein YjbI with pentapeptide repeats